MAGNQEAFQQAMNQGHSAAWDQSWDRAAAFYRQALEEVPNHPQALTNLGLALYEMQEYEEALRCYIKAAQASPKDPLPIEKVAQLYERLGKLNQASQASLRAADLYLANRDVNKALDNWTRVTRLQPENLQAHSHLALIYEKTGKPSKAAEEYLAVASLMQSAGEIDKAAKGVQKAMQLAPNNPAVHQAIGLLRESRPLPKPARQPGGTAPLRMAQVRQLEEGSAETGETAENQVDPVAQTRQTALTVLAGMLFETAEEEPDHQSGRRDLLELVTGAGGKHRPADRSRIILHLSQVVDLQTRGQSRQAATELERAMDAGLRHPAAYFDLGFLQHQAHEYEQALQSLQAASKHPDFALGAQLLRGEILKKIDRQDEAAIAYLEALRLADAQMVDAAVQDDLRQLYDPVIEAYQREATPEHRARLCENVSGLLMRPDWRRTMREARQQLPSSHGGPPIPLAEILTEASSSQVVELLSEINRLANEGKLRAAMEEAFYAFQYAPTYLPLHSLMGDLLLRQDRVQEAVNKFVVVGRTYNSRGDVRKAVELYRRVVEFAPMDMSARSRLIEQLLGMDRVEEALGEYLALGEIYYNLADLDMSRKTYTSALRQAQQSNVDRSWRVKILHRMADIDRQSLDWRQALRVYEQIRTIQPRDEKARTSLVYLNFRLGQTVQALAELDDFIGYLLNHGEKEKAVRYMTGLLAEIPEQVSLHQRLADLYRKLGNKAKAVEQLDTAAEMLLQSGEKTGAIHIIQTILSLNPPQAEKYRELLETLRSGT